MADSMEQLTEQAKAGVRICLEEGADRAAVIDTARIPFDKGLRAYCAANACGCYDKNWACPPGVGEPDEVIARAKGYRRALVFQAVGRLEDSFDFEGMVAAERPLRRAGGKDPPPHGGDAVPLSSAHRRRLLPLPGLRQGGKSALPFPRQGHILSGGLLHPGFPAGRGLRDAYHSGENTITNFGAFLFDE